VKLGSYVSATVQGFPKHEKVSTTITINGKQVSLGSVTSDAKGGVSIPKLKITKPGTYYITLTDASGKKSVVKYVVPKKG